MMKNWVIALTMLLAVIHMAGCGGGRSTSGGGTPSSASAMLTLQWPSRATIMPVNANSIRLQVRQNGVLKKSIQQDRPAAGGTQQIALTDLPTGSLVFTLLAYEGTNCAGTPLASGNVTAVAQANRQLTLNFNIANAVASLEIAPTSKTMAVNETFSFTATARDSGGNPVLVTTGALTWWSSNVAVATVTNSGVVTALSAGMANIFVRENSSGKQAVAAVTVGEASRGEIAFISWVGGNFELCLMNGDGTNPRQLTRNTAWEDEPSWSWDGQRIYYISDRLSSIPNKWWFDVFVINHDGTNDHSLITHDASDWGPAMSPDGSKMLFFRSMGSVTKDEIFIANADGTDERLLIGANGMDVLPSFTPDGQQIVFASAREYPEDWDSPYYDIYIANADGTNIRRLTYSGGRDWYFSITPDGQQIVFDAGGGVIDIMNIDGSGRRRLLTPPAGKAYKHPSVSPDGRRVAFASNEADSWDIFVCNMDGSGKQRLTTTRGDDYMPKWRPVM